MKTLQLAAMLVLVAALAAACADAPKVAQGTVVSYQADAKSLTVKDEKSPHSELTFSLADAEIGADPVVGDTVRVAYHEKPGEANLSAVRVMNLTRQSELKREGEKKPK